MAIEQSLVEFKVEDPLDCEEDIRNAPTPQLPLFNEELFFGNLDDDLFFHQNISTSTMGHDITFDSNFGNSQTFSFQQSNPVQYVESAPSTSLRIPSFNSQAYQTQTVNANLIENSFSDSNSMNASIFNVKSDNSKKNKEKCMTRNAIAARENREKKKKETQSLYSKLQLLEEEAGSFKKQALELRERCKKLQERNNYLESIVQNIPSITQLIDHMKSMPNGTMITNVNLHTEKFEEETHKKFKQMPKVNLNDFNNNTNPGICFHVKASKEMSLQFCHTCSNKNSKRKIAET